MSHYTVDNVKVANLFRQAQEGDARSLELLMCQHEGLVHVVARRQWRGCLGYRETVHEGRIGLWRAILGFDPGHGVSFSTYAGVAIARKIWQAVKLQQAKEAKQGQVWDWEGQASPGPGVLSSLLLHEVQEAVQAQVQGLPARQRWIVEAHYGLQGHGPQTMAALGRQLSCSRQAISYHHQCALQRLRHPAFSARLRELLDRNRREDYLQALHSPRRGS